MRRIVYLSVVNAKVRSWQGWGRYSKFEKILDTDTCLPPVTADPVRYSNSANFTDPDTDTDTDTAKFTKSPFSRLYDVLERF